MNVTIVILLVLLLGVLFQYGYIFYVKKRYLPIGTLTRVGKSIVHSIVSGSGEDLVVFLGGNTIASTWTDMYELQKNISPYAKTVVYERPGYGWSPLTSEKRTIQLLVSELHSYLMMNFFAFMKKKKLIFVVHSMSGLEALFYAKTYPEFVKGIVFIEAASPVFCINNTKSVPFVFYVIRFFRQIGVLNVLLRIPAFLRLFDARKNNPLIVQNVTRRMIATHYLNRNTLEERRMMGKNGEQVLTANRSDPLPHIQVIICTSEKNPLPYWKEGQLELATFFVNAKVVNFATNNHMLHHEFPQEICELILSLLSRPAKLR